MTLTHIFFDLHGTLIDGAKLLPCYAAQLGQIMAARYGGQPEAWEQAHRTIALDWDSYYADLDLSQGIEQVYEGLYRTTRALFRLTSMPEPPHEALTSLSRTLTGLTTSSCDALYADTKAVVETLYQRGYTLGVTTHALYTQAVGLLEGGGATGGIRQYFHGVIIGVDTLEKYERDAGYFREVARLAGVSPEACLVVDDLPGYLSAASHIGMQTLFIDRKQHHDLTRLIDFLGSVLP